MRIDHTQNLEMPNAQCSDCRWEIWVRSSFRIKKLGKLLGHGSQKTSWTSLTSWLLDGDPDERQHHQVVASVVKVLIGDAKKA